MKNQSGGCHACCQKSLIKVGPKEIEAWKKKQRYDIILCLEQWTGHGVYLMQKDNHCIFLGLDGCDIYDERPKVCRDFPLGKVHVKQFNCLLGR